MLPLVISKQKKLLQKERNNPTDWSIDHLIVVANRNSFTFRKRSSSHVNFKLQVEIFSNN